MASQPDTLSSPPHETLSTASAIGVVESLADAIDSVLTVSEVEDYRYETLDKSTQEIRLLLLRPSKDPTKPIELSIFKVPLQNANPYWALSYTWGDASFREKVQLNKLKFSVTRNLFEALKSLQSRLSDELRLWVDAVCINQGDLDERSQQVKMMCHIYAQADIVAAFMGPLEDGVSLGYQLITVLA
ncbi:heterokaryon incompatibility protein-domain-containing protein, partial [Bisporella sp. PMI_857]